MPKRRLAVLTTGRQDWGLLRPLCDELIRSATLEPVILAGGMACSPAHGLVVDLIRQTGLPLAEELAWDVEAPVEQQAARALQAVGGALRRLAPEALILLGDRYETAAAALAATLLAVPVVHLHGGEETEGAIDNALRHAITKLAHLHLVAHEVYARRVLQLGEDPASVHVVGSLAVDNLAALGRVDRARLAADLGVDASRPIGLVTVHPTTLTTRGGTDEVDVVIGALEQVDATWIVTLPNADPGNGPVRERLVALGRRRANVLVVPSLGSERYLAVMAQAFVVLGNSSSGMIEAPALHVPTVNVGERQGGRLRFASILDVAPVTARIVEALQVVRGAAFLAAVQAMPAPFGEPPVASRVVALLERWVPPRPPRKRFHDTGAVASKEDHEQP